jgi:hypothetical protein
MDHALTVEERGFMHEFAPRSAAIGPVLVRRRMAPVRGVFTVVGVMLVG